MCGICGMWLRSGRVLPETLIAMRDSIGHRGPDGASGVLVSSAGERPVPFREDLARMFHVREAVDDRDCGMHCEINNRLVREGTCHNDVTH